MADVFLSYKREDQQVAREVAADLEAEGFSVFFDVNIDVGDSWDERIEGELDAAKAVVVLWSPKSRESKWVRREAREAMARGILCPAMIARCKVPVEFSDVQAADLTGRRARDLTHSDWRRLLAGVERCVGPKARSRAGASLAPTRVAATIPPKPRQSIVRRALLIGAGAAATAAIGGGGYWAWYGLYSDFPRLRGQFPAAEVKPGADFSIQPGLVLRGGDERSMTSAAFSPDGARVATSSYGGTSVWDVGAGVAEDQREITRVSAASSVAFSPDGTRIVTADGWNACVWNAATGTRIALLRGQSASGVTRAAFSPDGTRIFTVGTGRGARAWDIATAEEFPAQRQVSGRRAVAVNADGTRFITIDDWNADVWDMYTAERIMRLPHGSNVGNAWFSPDGAYIATSAAYTRAFIWDAAASSEGDARQVASLQLPNSGGNSVRGLAFSPDGARIVTTDSWGYAARVWSVATWRETAILRGHGAEVIAAAFSPDGRRAVTASNDGSARLWDFNTA